MRALLAGLVMVAAVGFGATPVFEEVRTASACSCPDCDTIRDSAVIVGGTVTAWEPSVRPAFSSGVIPIQLTVQVDAVYKGYADSPLVLFDDRSLVNLTDPARPDLAPKYVWMGGAGGCQAFTEDPLGKYIVTGLQPDGPTALGIFGPGLFFVGERTDWFGPDSRRADLEARTGSPRPPSVGDSPPEQAAGSDDWWFVSTIGGACLLVTLVLLLVGPRRDGRR